MKTGISTVNRPAKDQIQLSEGYLPTDKITKIDKYLRVFGFISQSMDEYIQGNIRGKMKKPANRMYGFILLCFFWFIFARNVLLAYVYDPWYRNFLGETAPQRPAKQFTMAITIWSCYAAILMRLYYRGERLRYLKWMTPFLIFKGVLSPGSHGMDSDMTYTWFERTKKRFRTAMMVINAKWLMGSAIFSWVAYVRWKSKSVDYSSNILWSILLTVWIYYCSAITYVTYAYFESLCFYFRMRFNKINNDIESIIDPHSRMKPNERCSTLHHVLIEHNELCMNIKAYNVFWSKYLMYTYFMIVSVTCYSLFQAFFTYNTYLVRALMFMMTIEGSVLITKISICASLLANEAHASYNRLIRVTFDHYPVDLQIQCRMFIQRLSGPTIGFYVLDLFEITYSTYASIVAALGQNFLLIVDFVRSYAELQEERAEASEAELSLFNTSLSFGSLGISGESQILPSNLNL